MSSTETQSSEAESTTALWASTPLNSVAGAISRSGLPMKRKLALTSWSEGRSLEELTVLQDRINTAILGIVLDGYAECLFSQTAETGLQSQSPRDSQSPMSAGTDTVRDDGTGAEGPPFSDLAWIEMTLEQLQAEHAYWDGLLKNDPEKMSAGEVKAVSRMRREAALWITRRSA